MAKNVDVTRQTRSEGEGLQPFLTLRGQMDRLFDDFMSDWRLPSLTGLGRTFPSTSAVRAMVDVKFDVSETEEAVEITAELPGIAEDDVEVTLANGVLTISGEKKTEEEKKERNYYMAERAFGSFSRSVRLPETVDSEAITARFDKGVLTVSMPKVEEARSAKRRIEISKEERG